MIHALLVLAVILFLIWLLLHTIAAVTHLLWIVIVIAVAVWAARMVMRRMRA
jgi:hypothetical protein